MTSTYNTYKVNVAEISTLNIQSISYIDSSYLTYNTRTNIIYCVHDTSKQHGGVLFVNLFVEQYRRFASAFPERELYVISVRSARYYATTTRFLKKLYQSKT